MSKTEETAWHLRSLEDQATEFQRRRNFPSVEVKRMGSGKVFDVILYCRERGKEIGWKTEIARRGKVGVSYLLAPL